jgi:hypothetical protein
VEATFEFGSSFYTSSAFRHISVGIYKLCQGPMQYKPPSTRVWLLLMLRRSLITFHAVHVLGRLQAWICCMTPRVRPRIQAAASRYQSYFSPSRPDAAPCCVLGHSASLLQPISVSMLQPFYQNLYRHLTIVDFFFGAKTGARTTLVLSAFSCRFIFIQTPFQIVRSLTFLVLSVSCRLLYLIFSLDMYATIAFAILCAIRSQSVRFVRLRIYSSIQEYTQ